MTDKLKSVPSVSVSYARNGNSTKANALGMRPMQERAYERRGEQYLLIKSPPASGKSRALMFVALDKLHNQGLKQAIIVVPEKSIGASFNDEPLTKFGFWADWTVQPKWNLCNAPGEDGGKVNSVGAFLESGDKVLVCTHATFRFAVDKFGIEKFDDRLIAVDEFHHVSADPDSKLGQHLGQLIDPARFRSSKDVGAHFGLTPKKYQSGEKDVTKRDHRDRSRQLQRSAVARPQRNDERGRTPCHQSPVAWGDSEQSTTRRVSLRASDWLCL